MSVIIEFLIILTLQIWSLYIRLSFIHIGGRRLIMSLLFLVVNSGGRTC